MIGLTRDQVLSQSTLATAILVGMAGVYAVTFVISRYVIRCNAITASLRALAIGGPAVPFVAVVVLQPLFGTIPISVASLVMNLIEVPATTRDSVGRNADEQAGAKLQQPGRRKAG
jgi:malonate transporter and related proteins